jgi:tripartite ATP-independent transporter DctM subunit
MNIELVTLLLFGGMFLFLAAGFPVAFGLGGVCMALAFWLLGPESVSMALFGAMAIVRYSLLVCIPMFVFMGMMMYHSGIADDLYTMFEHWLAPVPGSLAAATVGVCTIFAAMVGSVDPAILTMGTTALPIMRSRGYSKSLVTGCIMAGAALGFLIPPSVIAILYALVAKESIGKLFAGGLFPGLVLSFLIIAYIIVRVRFQPHLAPGIPKEDRLPWKQRLPLLRAAAAPMIIILATMGSILSGLTTPVEASAVGAGLSAIAAALKRRLTWAVIKDSFLKTLELTTIAMWIFMAALTFGKVYAALGAKDLIELITVGLPLPPIGILVIMMLTFFILGMILDDTAILFITMPIYVPIIRLLGFDPVWFGVLYLVNMQMAFCTPPFGYCLFLMKGVAPPDISMMDIYKSVWPFVAIQAISLVILMVFPQLATWLPSKLFGGG